MPFPPAPGPGVLGEGLDGGSGEGLGVGSDDELNGPSVADRLNRRHHLLWEAKDWGNRSVTDLGRD